MGRTHKGKTPPEIEVKDLDDFCKQMAEVVAGTMMPLIEMVIKQRLRQVFEVVGPEIKKRKEQNQ